MTTNNINLFLNDNIESRYFYKASSYPSYFDQLKEIFIKLKFKDVQVEKTYDSLDALKFVQPTLVIMPRIQNLPTGVLKVVDENLKKLFSSGVFRSHNPQAVREFCNHTVSYSDEIIRFDFVSLRSESTIIGLFSNSKNCVILYFNPFATDKRIKFMQDVMHVVERAMLINLVELKEDPEVIKKLAEDYKKKQIQSFISFLKKRVEEKTNEIHLTETDIERYNKTLISSYQKIFTLKFEAQALENRIADSLKSFEEMLGSLEKLQFVKKIEFVADGIRFDVGQITLDDTYIGNFLIEISPSSIRFYNPDQMTQFDQHPHIRNNHGCFGDASDKINKMLAGFQLKELLFLLYQFLNTYSVKGGPYTSIQSWKNFRNKKPIQENSSQLIENARNRLMTTTGVSPSSALQVMNAFNGVPVINPRRVQRRRSGVYTTSFRG